MLDALLFAVRDAIRNAGYGYDYKTCELMASGQPPPRCGSIFVAVHPGRSRSTALNYLDEMFSFSLTLTQRITLPADRVGDAMLASKLARVKEPGPGTSRKSFNERLELLRAFMHMNWAVLQDANTNLANMEPEANQLYGFCEPAHYAGVDGPRLEGPFWFDAEPVGDAPCGLVTELKFEDCRRFQGIATFA